MDDVWDADSCNYDQVIADKCWNRLQHTFGTLGYREGVNLAKEGKLQRGFDAGFQAGSSIAFELGRAIGSTGALIAILAQNHASGRSF